MILWRLILTIALGLSLSFSGSARGVLAAQSLGGMALTICDDHGTRQILVDAKGQEIPRGHSPCPDCTLALVVAPDAAQLHELPLRAQALPTRAMPPWQPLTPLPTHAYPRGPPLSL